MIPKYTEKSQEVEIHSERHAECTPEHIAELEEGWECQCDACQCETVVSVQARYTFNADGRHGVHVKVDGHYITITPDTARALASALCFAANDAETLDKEYPL